MVMKVNLHQAKELAAFYMSAGLLPMLHGTFGLGKSAIVQEIAKENNLLLLDKRLSQCEPTDLQGFPKERNGRLFYAPPEDIPLEGDSLPIKVRGRDPVKKGDVLPDGKRAATDIPGTPHTYYDGWLLFLDEINSADEDVQSASYKVTLDRMVGQRKVHEACFMIAAGNLATDNAIVNEMSTALMTRMVHIEIDNDLKVFMNWASKKKIDPRITSFLNWKPSYLHDVPLNQDDHTFATNRTWEFADRVFKNMDIKDELFIPALAGCVSAAKAMELKAHIEVYSKLPEYSAIVADPEYIDIPHEAGTLWAMLGKIGDEAKKQDMDQLMKFVNRLPKEHQVVLMLDIGRKNRTAMGATAANRWCQHNANVIMD